MSEQLPTNIRVDVHHHHHHYHKQEQPTEFRTRKEEQEGPTIGHENSFAPRPEVRVVNEK